MLISTGSIRILNKVGPGLTVTSYGFSSRLLALIMKLNMMSLFKNIPRAFVAEYLHACGTFWVITTFSRYIYIYRSERESVGNPKYKYNIYIYN